MNKVAISIITRVKKFTEPLEPKNVPEKPVMLLELVSIPLL